MQKQKEKKDFYLLVSKQANDKKKRGVPYLPSIMAGTLVRVVETHQLAFGIRGTGLEGGWVFEGRNLDAP